jgi:hypothetical protein
MRKLFEEIALFEITDAGITNDPQDVEDARSTNNHWEMGATEVAKFKKIAGGQWKYVNVVHDVGDNTYPFFVFMRPEYDKQPYIDRLWNVWGKVLGVEGDVRTIPRFGDKRP